MQPVGEIVSCVDRDVPFTCNEEKVHVPERVEEFMYGVSFIFRFTEVYLYKIVEKNSWSWSYDLDKITDSEGNLISSENEVTSDQLIVNPFIFVNKKPTDSRLNIRHAESAVYNDFRTTGTVQGIDSGSKKKLDPEPEPSL